MFTGLIAHLPKLIKSLLKLFAKVTSRTMKNAEALSPNNFGMEVKPSEKSLL